CNSPIRMCSSCRRSPARRRKRRLGRRRSCPSSGEASRPPHPLLDVLLLGDSVADLFRAFTSIGPADHGKDVSLAGWAEDVRTLDLRKPERRAIFSIRAIVASAFRDYLERQSFVEVQTPKLAGAGAEGGATLFQTDYFGRKAYLSQSPQLYKQMLMSTGLDRVFEIAPAFRAEPSDTVRHVTEFESFDGEVAWIERQEDVFGFLEGAVDQAIQRVRAAGKSDLELLGASPVRPKLPFKRVRYEEALEILRGQGKRLRDGDDIDTESEKLLGQSLAKEGHEIYFLTGYPISIKPFYVMADPDDP